eukprot:8293765-Pyramimonas_sp.AAC.1
MMWSWTLRDTGRVESPGATPSSLLTSGGVGLASRRRRAQGGERGRHFEKARGRSTSLLPSESLATRGLWVGVGLSPDAHFHIV